MGAEGALAGAEGAWAEAGAGAAVGDASRRQRIRTDRPTESVAVGRFLLQALLESAIRFVVAQASGACHSPERQYLSCVTWRSVSDQNGPYCAGATVVARAHRSGDQALPIPYDKPFKGNALAT